MSRSIATAWSARRCLAQTRQKTPCQQPAMRGKRRCRKHGGKLTGAPRGNQRALKHGRYSQAAISERQRARRERHRLRQVTMLARYGLSSIEELFAALQARLT